MHNRQLYKDNHHRPWTRELLSVVTLFIKFRTHNNVVRAAKKNSYICKIIHLSNHMTTPTIMTATDMTITVYTVQTSWLEDCTGDVTWKFVLYITKYLTFFLTISYWVIDSFADVDAIFVTWRIWLLNKSRPIKIIRCQFLNDNYLTLWHHFLTRLRYSVIQGQVQA